MLGNNMFAYCGNNPVRYQDNTGNSYADTLDKDIFSVFGGEYSAGSVSTTPVVTPTVIGIVAFSLGSWLADVCYTVSADFVQFAKSLVDYSAGRYANHQPRIHHVIPKGTFAHYGDETYQQVQSMHKLLMDVGISIDDAENLLIISHGTHKSMHTKEYINAIYDIMKTAEPGNKRSVRWCLFLARNYAASLDEYPNGY